jgi:hypothetical protein
MTTDNFADKQSAPKGFSLSEKITLLLGVVTLVGILLALMGLGVALSAEIQFGIPHATLFGSYFELLQLAAWGVANLFTGLKGLLADPAQYLSATYGSMWVIARVTIFLGVLGSILKWIGRARLLAISRKECIAWLFRKPSINQESYRILWARVGLFGITAAVVGLIVPILVLAATLIFCLCVALVPVLSVAAGDAHIRNYVVGPDICFPTLNSEGRKQEWDKPKPKPKPDPADSKKELPKAATCVSILDGQSVLFSGRVVWATAESILLFDPGSGEVRRMSLKDRDIKLIDNLPVPSVHIPAQPNTSITQPDHATDGAVVIPKEG